MTAIEERLYRPPIDRASNSNALIFLARPDLEISEVGVEPSDKRQFLKIGETVQDGKEEVFEYVTIFEDTLTFIESFLRGKKRRSFKKSSPINNIYQNWKEIQKALKEAKEQQTR